MTTVASVISRSGLAAAIWPRTARLEPGGEISVGGLALGELAARYGTPAYIVDEADVRHRCRTYREAFPEAEIAYAGKAFLCRAMASWIDQEGLSLDVCSAGELAVAGSVGFPSSRIVLHGNAKTPGDLQAAADAVRRVLAQPELELAGLHCHLGSQITQLPAFELAARRLIALMAAVYAEHGRVLPELNLGGGHAVPYVETDRPFDLAGLAERIRRVVHDECASFRLPVPRLTFEPGRAIISRAMVTLYRVLTVKHIAGVRTFVAVDGG